MKLDIEIGLSFTSPIKVGELAIRGAGEDTEEGKQFRGCQFVWVRGNRPSIGAKKPDFTCQSIDNSSIGQELGVSKGPHKGLKNDRSRSLNMDAIGSRHGGSHAGEF
jgi:hypothetical protein